ncbi:PhoH family protein [Acidiferrobacter sp.]|jgi:PhoH-like ATPase|uniref:PhoH family protein n=1 Tax=Acidiferrobacter sp. TaxID=1872107 RepID=UPI0034169060
MAEYRKLFVLDASVLMHDPAALYRFEEHDVYVPIAVLEELDTHKQGGSETARNARQASRFLDDILAMAPGDLAAGAPLPHAKGASGGRLFIPLGTAPRDRAAAGLSGVGGELLTITRLLADDHPGREAVLVSKDINLRIKARALGLKAEDYTSEQVLDDVDLLYRGIGALHLTPADVVEPLAERESGRLAFEVRGGATTAWFVGQFLSGGETSLPDTIVREVSPGRARLEAVLDYTKEGRAVWGVWARNREQNFALNLLMDPDIDFVTLLGHAGTGKTLLTLAAGLEQTIEQQRYTEIIMTRVTIPVGEDIGFLPGTEEEKMNPWMGALEDNLDILNQGEAHGRGRSQWARAAAGDLIRARIRVKSLNFMRGRTFLRKFIIIDEAQNLSARQMKTLITRAGPGSKVVCLGNIAQIDSPYLTETTSGLTYVVDRFKGWAHGGHVTLERGERSRLADHATATL